MPWILANAYGEEPDALIALVRVCGGALQETGGLYPEKLHETEVRLGWDFMTG